MRRQLVAASLVIAAGGAVLLNGGSFAGAQGQQQEGTRQTPTRVTATVSPRVERSRPWTFTVRGRVQLPPPGLVCPPGQTRGQYCLPLPRERACDGARVSIRYKGGRRTAQTISTRRYNARSGGNASDPPFCEYRGTVTFNRPERLRPNGRLQIDVRFLGNQYYGPRSSPRRFARAVPESTNDD